MSTDKKLAEFLTQDLRRGMQIRNRVIIGCDFRVRFFFLSQQDCSHSLQQVRNLISSKDSLSRYSIACFDNMCVRTWSDTSQALIVLISFVE